MNELCHWGTKTLAYMQILFSLINNYYRYDLMILTQFWSSEYVLGINILWIWQFYYSYMLFEFIFLKIEFITISEYSQYNNSESKNSLWETQSNAVELKYINQLMYLGTFFIVLKGFIFQQWWQGIKYMLAHA